MQVAMKVHHLRQQVEIMIDIVISGICQEMKKNGQQSTLPALAAMMTSTLVFLVEGITTKLVVLLTIPRLTAVHATRSTSPVVYAPYFM